jgi:hypothetical protein
MLILTIVLKNTNATGIIFVIHVVQKSVDIVIIVIVYVQTLLMVLVLDLIMLLMFVMDVLKNLVVN